MSRLPREVKEGTVEYLHPLTPDKINHKTVEELTAYFREIITEEAFLSTAKFYWAVKDGQMTFYLRYRQTATPQQIEAWDDYQKLKALKQKLGVQGYIDVLL